MMEPRRPGALNRSVWKSVAGRLVGARVAPAIGDGRTAGLPSEVRPAASSRPASADDELIECARRDPAAFAAIYRLHYQAIGRYLYRRVGDTSTAEDLVSETFLVAFRDVARFESRGIPILHWLYRIATRAANRWARRRRFLDLARVSELIAAVPPDRAYLHQALRRLPTRFQEVLALHYFAELPIDDMARLLTVAPGTVKSRLARAREALRARLRRDGS